MNEKYCPLKITADINPDCDGEKCAWWDDDNEMCSIWVLGRYVHLLWAHKYNVDR